MKPKKWEFVGKGHIAAGAERIDELIDLLLENRGIKTAKERDEFLYPTLEAVTPESVGIDLKELTKALKRIKKAIDQKEQIVVFGDYDVDGITGSAILWETLHALGAKVLPYIPHRVDEGYGLSSKGISNVQLQISNVKLIITTDNGIVAHDAVEFANEQGIDIIITDHHARDATVPKAYAIVHTTKLCGAGVAFLLAKEISNDKLFEDKYLELATLGTVADLVPLVGANRTIVREGLKILPQTKRVGLKALYQQAGLEKDEFTPYDIGFVIGPRLNASGRIESAMDSLRLLCTTKRERAEELAAKLELVNKERQQLLKEAKEYAIAAKRKEQSAKSKKLLISVDENYAEGIIGLVAGKLVEEFYRPAIVIAKREKQSKASVRSVSGFNIIEFLRMHADHFVNVGGHPMAAGFTIETTKITLLQKTLEKKAEELLTDEMLTRSVKIDCELPFSVITKEVYDGIQRLAPFGMGNSEPVFATRGVTVEEVRIMGKEGTHLKLVLKQETKSFEAVGFGMGALAADLHAGDTIDVAYTIDENVWNGNVKLQLKMKDITS
ncbi:MAG TPA: single-stranded-DNA-specific exonuclease RecJ [Patescibacteria group bacterium]|nr:single-stranded-DNA-specific exonuclease RecJ [Patescibacteria group bacterium]